MSKWSLTLGAAALLAAMTLPVYAADTVTCKDGSTSNAGQGACSHHGGVQKGGAPAAAAAAPAAASAAPAAAAATSGEKPMCKDGTVSEKSGKGACSHHGGVQKGGAPVAAAAPAASPVAPEPVKPAAAPKPATAPTVAASGADAAGATAHCKDGTYSHSKSHSGACSHHGGVAEWLAK